MKHYLKYLKYILEHKKNVFKICWKKKMYLHAFTHDLSKFSPKEFFAYANWFHGELGVKYKKGSTKCIWDDFDNCHNHACFDFAWKHHKDKNKHHWNYWSERNLDMPLKYIEQMVIDWSAMGIKFGDTAQEFYLNNYNKIELSNSSRMNLEYKLGLNDSIAHNYGHTLKQFYEMDSDVYFGNRYFGWIKDKYKVDLVEKFRSEGRINE